MVMISVEKRNGALHYDVLTNDCEFACALYWVCGEESQGELDLGLARNTDGTHVIELVVNTDKEFDRLYQLALDRVNLQFTGKLGDKTITVLSRL